VTGPQPSSGKRRPTLSLGDHLTASDAVAAGRRPARLRLANQAAERIQASAARIAKAVKDKEWVYGVTTGFGSNAVNPIGTTCW